VIVEATAPGKLVLSGEYAVLAGAPALVLAVERRASVAIEPHGDGWCIVSRGFEGASRHTLDALTGATPIAPGDPARIVAHVLRAMTATGIPRAALPADASVEIDSRAGFHHGAKLGIGTSAAVATAVAAACLALAGTELEATLDVALAAHRALQGGKGSGLDVAAAHYGGLVRFERGASGIAVERRAWPDRLAILPVWTGSPADTRDYIARFDAYRAGRTDALTPLVDAARAVVAALPDAHAFMRELRAWNEQLLGLDRAADLGIFGTHHRRLYDLAPEGVVYKPCGAGGGDFGIACALDPEVLAGFEAAAAAAGHLPMRMEIAPHGVDVSITR
jgi:phosphomevalonate kinase